MPIRTIECRDSLSDSRLNDRHVDPWKNQQSPPEPLAFALDLRLEPAWRADEDVKPLLDLPVRGPNPHLHPRRINRPGRRVSEVDAFELSDHAVNLALGALPQYCFIERCRDSVEVAVEKVRVDVKRRLTRVQVSAFPLEHLG